MANYTSEHLTVKPTDRHYDYLFIGGGVVAGYAAKGIRELDKTGTIGILSSDIDGPYTRPALTKKLWSDPDFTQGQVSFNTAEETGAMVELEVTVTSINRKKHTVQLKDGSTVGYGKLLLATGGEPIKLDGPVEDEHVLAFRSWDDYRHLRDYSGDNQHVIVVGGSYIGTELAANLVQNNTQVTLIYPDNILQEKRFPKELAKEYEDSFREAGVELRRNTRAESYEREGEKLVVHLDDGTTVQGDTLVLGLGVSPRVSLAEDCGLEVENGVIVDEYLRTSDPDIYAAGDIASYPDPIMGRRRIEHVDHARKSGSTVGKIMAGSTDSYDYTPYVYSIVFDISWKAIGKMDPSLDTFFDETGGGKIVYYLKDNKPVGVLLWNVEVDLDEVRSLLKNPPEGTENLRGALKPKED